jgi:ATP-binding cassette, subfamily B, multidrug efflux pump
VRREARREVDDEVPGRAFDRRLIRRLWEAAGPHRRLIVGATLLFPAVSVLELAQPYLLKVGIDRYILRGDWLGLTRVGAVFLGSLVALYGLRMAESYLMAATGQRVMHDLREALFAHLLALEARFYDTNPVGRLMTRVLNDVEAVNDAFASGLFAVVADVVTLVGVVAVMFWMDWRLTLVAFSLMPVLVIGAGYFRVRARDAYRTVRQRLGVLNGFLQESLQGMSVIQLFARERHELREFRRLNKAYRRSLFQSTIYEASLYAGVEAVGSVAVALLLWYGAGGIGGGTLTFGTLVAFIQYTNRFFLPIRDLGAKYTVMQSAMASSERIFGLLERAPAIASPPTPVTPRRAPSEPAVELRSVWYAYEDERWVLRDCSLTVAPGEHVAIVGATGEGKTTCARLLNRSYDARRGQVLVDGVDVREWDLWRLRRHVGVVFQDTLLFAGTVDANLRLGADGDDAGAAEEPAAVAAGHAHRRDVERAIELANAGAFIRSLPRGLDEELGERGANVSHGQRQLLAIARALVYNPAVLVMDEATSSVDPESERLIQTAMQRLLEGRTTITIAHRLSTIQHADRILVLHRGRVHEEGTHAELVRRGGLYATLHELQFGARALERDHS